MSRKTKACYNSAQYGYKYSIASPQRTGNLLEKKLAMNSRINFRFLTATVAVMIMVSCSDDSDDPSQNPNNPPPPPGGGEVTVTSIPNGVFWGDELTITGTGFSTAKEQNLVKFTKLPPLSCSLQYTSATGGDIEIVNATATQLTIKVPLRVTSQGDPVCGPHSANIEVTVNGKTGTYEGVTFGPLPYIGQFNYHYGWFDVPKVTRVGDSVMLRGGLLATGPNDSEYWDKLRLSVDGQSVPIKFRSIALESGWAFFLPVKDFASRSCSDEPDGWAAKEMDFTFHILGTSKKASRKLFVQHWPEVIAQCHDCPTTISVSNPIPQYWKIRGKNMSYSEVRFAPINATNTASQSIAVPSSPWAEEIEFQIPISILTADYQFSVSLVNECFATSLGTLTLVP